MFLPSFDKAETAYRGDLARVAAALRKLRRDDLPADRAVIILRIADRALRVTGLRAAGCYYGSNASYNVDRLADVGLLEKETDPADSRAVLVRLTPQGRALRQSLLDLLDGAQP